jgi:hypothetical protein
VRPDEIATRFTHHPPTGDQPAKYQLIREKARRLAEFIVDATPESREQSLAITSLEETVFWANAAIARHPDEFPG